MPMIYPFSVPGAANPSTPTRTVPRGCGGQGLGTVDDLSAAVVFGTR
jgi:hypothetical protein